jgi:peptidoglycan/LPS O-acetylase OafA/YrhL
VLSVAWSLGIELLFYLLAPFLIHRSKPQLLALTLLGFALKIYAIVHIGNDLPYRMFPFAISDFLLGMLAYKTRFTLINSLGKHTPLVCYCLMLALTTALPRGLAHWVYSFLAIGVTAFIVPVLFDFTKRSKLDNRVGEASYPVYLFPSDRHCADPFHLDQARQYHQYLRDIGVQPGAYAHFCVPGADARKQVPGALSAEARSAG